MTEKEYKQCLAQALCPAYEAMLPDSCEEHTFSAGFERQMDKLIRRRRKPYYLIVNTLGKRIAVIAAALFIVSFTTVMSVGALRKPFINFVTNIFSSNSQISSDPEDSKEYPKTIESRYCITKGIDGYEKTHTRKSDNAIVIDYSKDDSYIYFEQRVADSFDENYNTEDAVLEHIDINGCDAIGWLDNRSYYHLIWNNGEYVIDIGSNIGKDKLIVIAESVQKVE